MTVSSVWYKESSVSVTQGQTTVVGTGALWLTQARQGDMFAVMDSGAASRLYEIDSITDNTHLELVNPYADATVTGAPYAIIRNFNTTTIGNVSSLVVTHIDEIKKAFQNNLKGDQGIPGYSVLGSNGIPPVSLGVDNDWCIDYASEKWNMYRKESGVWSLIGHLKGEPGNSGADGARWFAGTIEPMESVGTVGDCYLHGLTGIVYIKQSDGWVDTGIKLTGPMGETGGFGINWKGIWDVSTEYAVRDGIYYNGSSYVAVQDNVGQTPPDATTGGDINWQVVARRGLDGTGNGDMSRVDYDSDGDGKVNAAETADAVPWDGVANKPSTFTPEPHSLGGHTESTLAELNTLISDANVPSDAIATQANKGLMSAEDKTKLDALGSGGSSVMLTLVHTTILSSTTATAYEALSTGQIIGRSDWYGPKLTSLVRRSGSGQVRLSLSDGTTTITAETAVFAGVGTDKLMLDTSTLTDGVAWGLAVEALATTGTATVDRLKIMADPVNEFAPPLVGSGTGNSTNSTSWAELGTSTFLPTWLDVDGRGGVILLADVDLGTATGAEVRITVGTESATQAITSNGVAEIHCPFPSTPSAAMLATIEGRVTDGTGTINLSHWQLHIKK